jgi:hypothetical protein
MRKTFSYGLISLVALTTVYGSSGAYSDNYSDNRDIIEGRCLESHSGRWIDIDLHSYLDLETPEYGNTDLDGLAGGWHCGCNSGWWTGDVAERRFGDESEKIRLRHLD